MYQMADKCSDSVVSVVMEISAFVASNFDCNNFVTYCLDDCIVAVRMWANVWRIALLLRAVNESVFIISGCEIFIN